MKKTSSKLGNYSGMKIFALIAMFSSLLLPQAAEAAVLFESNWSTATGNTSNAYTDGGEWPSVACPSSVAAQVLGVVAGSTANWTLTPNILQITNRGSSSCGQLETRTEIPQATSHYVRLYINVWDENQINFHPIAINCCGAIQANPWAIFNPSAGVSYRAKFGALKGSNFDGGADRRYWPPALNQRQWYRFEWYVEYLNTSTLTYRMWPRIYDMNGTLLYDADDYDDIDRQGETLQEYYDRGGTFSFSGGADISRRWAIGYEGTGGASDQGRRWFYAGFQVRDDAWPGPIGGSTSPAPSPSPSPSPTPPPPPPPPPAPAPSPSPSPSPTPPPGSSDVTSPAITITAPTANQVLPAGTTSTNLSLTTDEVALCRWGTSNAVFNSLPNSFGSPSTSFTASQTGLTNGQSYTRYVRCSDINGNASPTSATVTFSVASSSTPPPSPTPSPTPPPSSSLDTRSDINGDGDIDSADLAILIANWNRTGSGIDSDINQDNRVDAIDFGILLSRL